MMNIINPATEEIITSVQEDNEASLALKFERLKKSAKQWTAVPIQTRAEILEKFVSLLKENIEDPTLICPPLPSKVYDIGVNSN